MKSAAAGVTAPQAVDHAVASVKSGPVSGDTLKPVTDNFIGTLLD